MDEEGLDDLINSILQEADYYEKDLPRDLVQFATQLQGELQAGNFKNITGNLRRSMSVTVDGTNVKIAMLVYGYFLSFGVDGRNRRGAFGLTEDVASAFNEPVGYRFGSRTKSNRVPGITARRFYPEDIEQTLINIIENN